VSYKRKYQASPIYSYNAGAITAGSHVILDFENDNPENGTASAVRKYIPFNLTVVTNTSSQPVLFYPNQQAGGHIIPASSSRSFDKTVLPQLYSCKLKNNGSGNISDKQLYVTVSHQQYDSDDLIASLHKKLTGWFING
jgi:hypothetical protein